MLTFDLVLSGLRLKAEALVQQCDERMKVSLWRWSLCRLGGCWVSSL